MATRHAARPLTCLLALGMAGRCAAGALDVSVIDDHGAPLGLAAVYAIPDKPVTAPPPDETAVMDQSHKAFVPHVLVVQTGTHVDFPNNDTVSHHVYSFSEAKSFELPLYKGDHYPPLVFDNAGVVVLGCNMHDDMLGYIVVVDTPYFALTDRSGKAHLPALPAGHYTVRVWTERAARPTDLPAEREITYDGSNQALELRVKGKLLPEHDHGGSGLTWERY
ncbi:MAG TPA: methylamine utilization protein [Gammaproteobacteria bacterium]|nr:methylamine utilization protein [Gammaproteobacteria bacterium]